MSVIFAFKPSAVKADPSKERALPSVPADANGFARVPHGIASDRRLSLAARALVAALEFYARTQPTCCPSNGSLADYLGVHEGTVKRALVELVKAGHLRLEKIKPYRQNMTGRVIHLAWNDLTGSAGKVGSGVIGTVQGWSAGALPSPTEQTLRVERQCATGWSAGALPGRAPALHKEESEESEERNVTCNGHVSSSTMGKGAESREPEPEPEPVSLSEAMSALPGSKGSVPVNRVVNWIAADLKDLKSTPEFRKRVKMVQAGTAPLARLVHAYEAAWSGVKGDWARKPGAVFMTQWNEWAPRLTDAEAAARAKDEAVRAKFGAMKTAAEVLEYVKAVHGYTFELCEANGQTTIRQTPSRQYPPVVEIKTGSATHRGIVERKADIIAHLQKAKDAEEAEPVKADPPPPAPDPAEAVEREIAKLEADHAEALGRIEKARTYDGPMGEVMVKSVQSGVDKIANKLTAAKLKYAALTGQGVRA